MTKPSKEHAGILENLFNSFFNKHNLKAYVWRKFLVILLATFIQNWKGFQTSNFFKQITNDKLKVSAQIFNILKSHSLG